MDHVAALSMISRGKRHLPLALALLATPLLIGAEAGAQDPWPFAGRTPTRLGRTDAIGPHTPTIAWSVSISNYGTPLFLRGNPVMDHEGRIFIAQEGITAVDSRRRKVIWMVPAATVRWGPALAEGRVLWGTTTQIDPAFYCTDAATGAELWRFPGLALANLDQAAVADPNGVVYFTDYSNDYVYARRIADGTPVWTKHVGETPYSPALDYPSLLTTSEGYNCSGFDPLTGERRWTAPTGWWIEGLTPIDGGRVYVGSNDSYLYCFDATTGARVWRFFLGQISQGAVAVGHDGTVYCGTTGNEGRLFAVTPDGNELWRYIPAGYVVSPPIVAGDGTIYFCCYKPGYPVYFGWVYALRRTAHCCGSSRCRTAWSPRRCWRRTARCTSSAATNSCTPSTTR